MKVDKEIKKGVDEDIARASYTVRKILLKLLLWLLIATVIFSGIGLGVRYFKTTTDRVIFKQSVTYNEGVLDDLAKYKYEYDCAKDEVGKKAIASLVRSRFANYDKSKIENNELRRFLEACGA